jgi:hypothetical protein
MPNFNFFSNFFVVEDPGVKKSFRGQLVGIPYDEAGKLRRGEAKMEGLHITYLEGTSEPSNLFWNKVGDPFCLNKQVVDLFNQNQITGWTTTPALVSNRLLNKTIDDYFAVSVNGRVGPINFLKSDIVFKQYPGGKFPHFKGLYFEPESWDGSDIFMTKPDQYGRITGFMYVTKRFVDVFRKNNITNIRFINFNDYLIDCGMVKIGAPESLKKEIDAKIKCADV